MRPKIDKVRSASEICLGELQQSTVDDIVKVMEARGCGFESILVSLYKEDPNDPCLDMSKPSFSEYLYSNISHQMKLIELSGMIFQQPSGEPIDKEEAYKQLLKNVLQILLKEFNYE